MMSGSYRGNSRMLSCDIFLTSSQSILEVVSNHGGVRFTDHNFLGHLRSDWHRTADYRPKGSQQRDRSVRVDTDRGHLLAFLAVLLHGPNEPADWT